MKKLLLALIGKRFSVYVGNEFERTCDFMGLMKLLADYTDFFQYNTNEKTHYLSSLITHRVLTVDVNITVTTK